MLLRLPLRWWLPIVRVGSLRRLLLWPGGRLPLDLGVPALAAPPHVLGRLRVADGWGAMRPRHGDLGVGRAPQEAVLQLLVPARPCG